MQLRKPGNLSCAIVVYSVLLPGIAWQCLAQAPKQATLSGTVVNSATGSGVPHALVTFNGVASGYRFTDASGSFRVEGVPQGFYSLNATKPGFLSEEEASGNENAFVEEVRQVDDPSTQKIRSLSYANSSVELNADSAPAKMTLVPTSAMEGTVVDENSEPLDGVIVQAIKIKSSFTGVSYVPSQSTRTDDRGHYYMSGLTPGDYVARLAGEVSATTYFIGTTLNPNNDHRGVQPVYYPGVETLSSATVLHLLPGERPSADFRQTPEPAFDINGRLTGILPRAWTQIQLYRDGDRLPIGRASVNLSTGQFRVIDVPRGSYTLRALQYGADPSKYVAAEVPVSIEAEPLQNVNVELMGGVKIPVSVSYEAGAQPDSPVMLMLQPLRTPANVREATIGKVAKRPARIGQPGLPHFQTATESAGGKDEPPALSDVITDRYRLRATLISHSDYLASAMLGGVDVLNNEFSVNGDAGELHIVVRGDSATLAGQVTANDRPAVDAMVYLIPASGVTDLLKVTESDEQGHYEIEGVTPGDYRVRAWTGPPSAKDILSPGGTAITLGAGDHRTAAVEATSVTGP